jgi:hypothetical protein
MSYQVPARMSGGRRRRPARQRVDSLLGVLDLKSGVLLALFGLTLLPAMFTLNGRND